MAGNCTLSGSIDGNPANLRASTTQYCGAADQFRNQTCAAVAICCSTTISILRSSTIASIREFQRQRGCEDREIVHLKIRSPTARRVGATAICLVILSSASTVCAQGIEVSPFYGYRFGGTFFELYTAQPFDFDGAPASGVALDVPVYDEGLYFEGMFTHQAATVLAPPGPGRPAIRVARLRGSLARRRPAGIQRWPRARVHSRNAGVDPLRRGRQQRIPLHGEHRRRRESCCRRLASACGWTAASLPRSWTAAETQSRVRPASASSACTSTSPGRPSSRPA